MVARQEPANELSQMDISVIASSFALLFLAEMGDKTQLIAMTLAQRYRFGPAVAGVLLAFLILNLLAIAVGAALFRYVPQTAVLLAAGGLFLLFAYRSWRDSEDQEEEAVQPRGGYGALFSSFALIFVAELGDKTQLAMIALVAGTGEPWSVFAGGTLALWAVSLVGIAFGRALFRRIPRVWVNRVAGMLFSVFGVLAIAQAWDTE